MQFLAGFPLLGFCKPAQTKLVVPLDDYYQASPPYHFNYGCVIGTLVSDIKANEYGHVSLGYEQYVYVRAAVDISAGRVVKWSAFDDSVVPA